MCIGPEQGKMAEDEPIRVKLQQNLADFSSLTRKLLEGVAGDHVPARPLTLAGVGEQTSSVLDQLIERDKEIQQLVEKAMEMRSRQTELERVEGQLEKRNQNIRELQGRLQDAEKLLELAVYHGKQKLQSISQSKEGAVTPEELIRYAHRISQASSTVSPTGWQPTDPRRPYPQDIEMRSGYLGGFSPPDPQADESKDPAASSEPPEKKKIALSNNSGISLKGVNQTASKPAESSRPGFRMAFDEPDAMSEDSSSSSDEGT